MTIFIIPVVPLPLLASQTRIETADLRVHCPANSKSSLFRWLQCPSFSYGRTKYVLFVHQLISYLFFVEQFIPYLFLKKHIQVLKQDCSAGNDSNSSGPASPLQEATSQTRPNNPPSVHTEDFSGLPNGDSMDSPHIDSRQAWVNGREKAEELMAIALKWLAQVHNFTSLSIRSPSHQGISLIHKVQTLLNGKICSESPLTSSHTHSHFFWTKKT